MYMYVQHTHSYGYMYMYMYTYTCTLHVHCSPFYSTCVYKEFISLQCNNIQCLQVVHSWSISVVDSEVEPLPLLSSIAIDPCINIDITRQQGDIAVVILKKSHN